jgi:MFS family permease
MTERSQFRLLGERRFGAFFATQLLGAFNDNVFKNALVILIAFQAAGLAGFAPEVTVNLAGGVFILPFFLFSATAGQLADKYDKARIMRLVKLAEIAIMGIAAVGFVSGDVAMLFAALFLMGVHSTVFGPVKFAILPQALREEELVGGNALVETGTWAAILLGTILGGLLVAWPAGPTVLVPAVTIAVAVLGYAASRFVPPAPPPAPELRVSWNPVVETWRNLGSCTGTAPCSCRSSGCRGSGSTGRCSSPSSPRSPRTGSAATRSSPRRSSPSSPSASASARSPASGCRGTRSRSAWCRSARSD